MIIYIWFWSILMLNFPPLIETGTRDLESIQMLWNLITSYKERIVGHFGQQTGHIGLMLNALLPVPTSVRVCVHLLNKCISE